LSFGSVKASAGEFDYSWPWRNGEQWRVGQNWHGCIENNAAGCALDIQPRFVGQSTDLVAPKSGTITRACDNDSYQGQLTIGQMSILHIEKNSMVQNGVYLTKSTKIGNAFTPPPDTGGNSNNFYTWITDPDGRRYFKTPCGFTGGLHIHLKLSPIYQSGNTFQGSMAAIDGINISGAGIPNTTILTSQNTPPNNIVLPAQANYSWAMDNRCNSGDQVQVIMRARNDGQCQAMVYNSSNNTIINAYSKCLDAGDVNNSNNNWLRFSGCHGLNNQKFKNGDKNLSTKAVVYGHSNEIAPAKSCVFSTKH
jgi:hypothetical protein